ncbi:glycerol dehydrogenase [Desulfatirhabdium butyrativorans]|uniref:glycerol dehydrogenase n=1 Tax=Desulfatirhabdium butyrativorans TaxID=340467 RepID=UPI0003F87F4B|nr:glycerol dehydrogenase [Desulfatirhabdium butyrativorans]
MFLKAVFPGKYIQGEGVLGQLPDWIHVFGKKGLILASRTARENVLVNYRHDLEAKAIGVEAFQGECCETELNRLARVISDQKVDVLVGMGGGKTIDTAKIAADRAGIPVIVVPTIASTDAPCSGCAILYTEQGVFQSVLYPKMNPQVVLVDTNVIAQAPTRFLVAGMGDALATWFEARSCDRTQSMNECGGYSTMAGLHLAKLCYDTLLLYGFSAKLAAEQHVITPALNHIVEANILLSGIGFESSGLAAAHAIHNGLTALEPTHSFYHGEKVAFGVLAGLQLADASPRESDEVFSFCETIGLPTTLEDIGLKDIDRDGLMRVAEKACAPGEAIHHEAGKITSGKVLNALIAADALGRARKRAFAQNR